MRHRAKVDRALGIVQLRGSLASGAHLGDDLVEVMIAKSSSSHSSLHSLISPMKAEMSLTARWSEASATTSCCEGEEKLATAPGGEELDQRLDATGIVQTDYPS